MTIWQTLERTPNQIELPTIRMSAARIVEHLRPLVAVAEVGFDAEGDVVVDDPHDLGLTVELVEDLGGPVEQCLGVRDLG